MNPKLFQRRTEVKKKKKVRVNCNENRWVFPRKKRISLLFHCISPPFTSLIYPLFNHLFNLTLNGPFPFHSLYKT